MVADASVEVEAGTGGIHDESGNSDFRGSG
jgi:hypothetical protein